jgi:hypothetical protein
MKLEINVPVSGLDLASLLEGEQGLFLCQTEDKTTSLWQKPVTRSPSGQRPLANPSRSSWQPTVGPEPWFVTKISNSTELAEFRGSLYGREPR